MSLRRSRIIASTTLTAAACSGLILAGCSAMPGTPWSMSDQEREQATAYARAQGQSGDSAKLQRAPAARSVVQPRTPRRRATQAEAASNPPRSPQARSRAKSTSRSARASSADYANPRAMPNPATLGLLGLTDGGHPVSRASTRRGVSPMDSPGNVRQMSFADAGADFDVDVAPSGKRLVFASTRHRRTADIYIKRIGSAAITQLTNDPANDVMPTISPDGQRIAFASDRGGSWDLYLLDIAGGQPVRITSDEFQNLHPSFSPDGQKLVYCTFGSSSGQWELVVIDMNKPTVKQHIGHGLFPDWSPTGGKIVFQRARQRDTRWFSLWTVDMNGGEPSRFTEVAASANAAVITPAWSPDGRHLVFSTVLRPRLKNTSARPGQTGSNSGQWAADGSSGVSLTPSRADVWIMNANGSGRAKLTRGQYANLQPTWGPNGGVYYISDRGNRQTENIWMTRTEQALRVVDSQTASRGPTQSAKVQTNP